MNKRIIRAAVIAALIFNTVILGFAAFTSVNDAGSGVTIPEIVISAGRRPTPSPGLSPEATLESGFEEPVQTPAETPMPTVKPAQVEQGNSEAFQLNIKGKTISVAHGVEEATLKDTPGWLTTSAHPGEDGMCVVYGHRNRTHLRVLEKVEVGDPITVTTAEGATYTYTVTDILIFEKTEDMRLPICDGKAMVLVTCYPFRYSGSAPGKCVVVGKGK